MSNLAERGEVQEHPTIFYCGCWRAVGHFVWLPGMRRRPYTPGGDGAGPWQYLDSSRLAPNSRHGNAVLTQEGGWTALGIADRSVDTRGGSHATFAIEGTHTFDEALTLARRVFPEVIDRIERLGEIRDVSADYERDHRGHLCRIGDR